MKKLLPVGARDFLRTAKNGGIASAWEYFRSGRIYAYLPPLARSFPLQPIEIHVLTGRFRLTMALWMMASWITATERSWPFVIHDDGTFRSSDVERLTRLLPGCRVLLHAEATRQIANDLASYPLSLRCRNLHPLGKKLFDFPLFAQGDRFFSIDTDVLFFQKPEKLVQWCGEKNPALIFMEDINDSSLLSKTEVQNLFNTALTEKVNTGIIAMPQAAFSLETIETCLAKTCLLDGDPWYIEQTLYALISAVYGQVELLPKEYVMSLSHSCSPDALARHYVGAVRHFFYSEGMPWVFRNLRAQIRSFGLNQ